MNILDILPNTYWGITEESMQLIISIAEANVLSKLEGGIAIDIEAAMGGKPVAESATPEIRNGVAIMSLRGPMFPRANLMTQHSGATSVDALTSDLGKVMVSSEVNSVLFRVDSPGGNVSGISNFAHTVREAAAVKPVAVYVENMCASAALWGLSGADCICASPTAFMGSVGVLGLIEGEEEDTEGLAENATLSAAGGKIKRIKIVSPNAPKKGLEPTSKAGMVELRKQVAAVESVMLADIATGRGVSVEHVIAKYGQGGMLSAKEAKDVGMCDTIGHFEPLVAYMAEEHSRRKHSARS